MDGGFYHLEKSIGINLIPVTVSHKTSFTGFMQNHREHQLSYFCLGLF